MSDWLVSAVGFCGAALILLGYLQTTRGKWPGRSLPFQLVNLTGALLLIIYSVALAAYANVLLNTVWVAVAVVGLSWRKK